MAFVHITKKASLLITTKHVCTILDIFVPKKFFTRATHKIIAYSMYWLPRNYNRTRKLCIKYISINNNYFNVILMVD